MTINSKYVKYTYVTLLSLYENTENGSIRLFIIHDDLNDEDKRVLADLSSDYGHSVSYIDCDMDLLNSMPVFRGESKDRYPISVFSRLLIPKYIPQDVDKLLLLDSDLIFNQPIDDLYSLDMGEKYFAAAINMCGNGIIPKNHRYWYKEGRTEWIHYNIGVLLWNLKKIREDLPDDYLFKLAWKWKNVGVDSFDEELLNVEFGEDRFYRISEVRWNYIAPWVIRHSNHTFWKYSNLDELKEKCAIVHYATFAPWRGHFLGQAYELWWSWAEKTPYYKTFIEEIQPLYKRKLTDIQMTTDNMNNLLNIMQCIILFDGKKRVLDYLSNKNVRNLYVYGAGRIGECISELLKDSEIEIVAFVDVRKQGLFCGIPIIKPEILLGHNEDFLLVSNGFYVPDIMDYLVNTGMEWGSMDEILF
jgi:lipopolysaccharide biosynthesis glycosyltransferase